MNVFKMNQIAFGKTITKEKFPLASVKNSSSKKIFLTLRKPGHGAVFLVSLLTYLLGIFPSMVFALPKEPVVQSGSLKIETVSPKKMNIYQNTQKAIIDWNSFSISSNEHVDFQLSQGGVTLNRITGNDPSNILGKLSSNGDLWVINPNGIFFGNNSQIDVRGLVATTANITNSNFLNNNYKFEIPSSYSNSIVNKGKITAAEGGLVALVAPGVQNLGVINARLGKVSLSSGKTFTLDLYGDQLINLGLNSKVLNQVTGMNGDTLSSLVTNSGQIFADGGVVRLDVNAAQDIVDQVINMDGVIQARSVTKRNGKIILTGGSKGHVNVSGKLDASGYNAGETGGVINIFGDQVGLYGTGLIDISGDSGGGTLLFGGDYQGKGTSPNALDTYIGPGTKIYADAVNFGNGGKAIFWADRRMFFKGIVKGRGGKYFGDGGFVEVSGKEELFFDGSVDTSAVNGKTGTLLLDPDTITVSNSSGTTSASGANTFTTIYESTLEAVGATTNITLQADNEIIIANLADNNLALQQSNGNTVTFKTIKNSVSRNGDGKISSAAGTIRFLGSDDTISTQGGDIIFEARGDLIIGSLISNGGNISLTGRTLNLIGNLNSGTGNVTIGSESKIFLGGNALSGCGVGFANLCDMSIQQSELNRISGKKLSVGGHIGGFYNGDIFVNGVTLNSFSDGVALNVDTHVSGSKGAIIFQADSSFSSLEAKAINGITLDANVDIITTTGALSLNGDTDSGIDSIDPNDNISLAGGATLTSTTSIDLSALTGGISVAGDLTVNAPSSITMTGNLTSSGDVALTANSGINLNGGISTSSGSLNINANSSTLTLNGNTTLSSTGALTVSAGNTSSTGNLVLISTGSTINFDNALVSGGNLTMTANSGLTLSNSNLTATRDINLQGGASLSLASGMNISGGNISLGGSSITANNGGLNINSTGSINISNSLASLTTASFNSSTGITMAGLTANGAINLNSGIGSTTITGALSTNNNALSITASDLSLTGSINTGTSATTLNVTNSGALGLGFSSGFSGMNVSNSELALITGNLNLINSNITAAAGTSVSLTGKLVIGESGGSITGQGSMTLASTKGLAVDSSINTTGNLSLEGDSNNSSETSDGITIASGVSLTSSAGTITLDATNGGITSPGSVTLNASGVINLNDNLSTTGAILIKSNGLSIGGTTLSSGAASTTIQTSLAGTTIGLCGAVCNGDFGFSITSTDFSKISAGSLIVGDSTNGNITVEGITTNIEDVTLNAISSSGRSITFNTGTSNFKGLEVNASNGIVLSSGITTQGATSFDSDTDTGTNMGGNFTLAASQSLITNNNSLSITANDVALGSDSSISSGTADTTLLAAKTGRTIGLGSGAGDFSLSNTELSLITAANIIVGNSNNGTILLAGLNSLSTPIILNATGTGSAVNFSAIASTGLGNLTVNAGTGGVDFGVNFTTTGSLNVNSTGAITDTGVLTVAGISSFTTTGSNQAITLDSALNSFNSTVSLNTLGTGNATLTSNNGLTLGASKVGGNLLASAGGNNSLNVSGTLETQGSATIQADNDIIFTADGDITTTSGNIILTADYDSNNNGSGGAITMDEGTIFDAGSNSLTLSADEDITLGLLTTSNSSTSSITLNSTNGGIRDADINALDIITNGRLVADLVTGFGTTDNGIETNLASVDIDNSISGDINIFELDQIDIFKINHAGTGDIKVFFTNTATNQQNITASQGAVSFTRRDTGIPLLVPGTSKSLKTLANERTLQFFTVYENNAPNFLPVDRARNNNSELPSLDLFSNANSLVEIGKETATYFDGLENLGNVWEGKGVKNKQSIKRKRPSEKILSKRSKNSVEKDQIAKAPLKKSSNKASINIKNISGKKKASYQSKRDSSKSPKPLFSLSQAESISFLP